MKTLRAGNLRDRVTFQARTLGTATEYGDAAEVWVDVCEVWGEVRDVSGHELYQAKKLHAEAAVQVTVRYDARVVPSGRFLFGTRYLYPISVTGDPQATFQTCLCRERVEASA